MDDLRKKELDIILKQRNCFKMICGAGNEDKHQVKRLSLIYTLAGASILDVSANVDVIKFSKQGIDLAYKKAKKLNLSIKNRPFIMVSVGMPGDHHVRKSYIDPHKCIACGLCIPVCPTDAIPKQFHKKLNVFKELNGSFEIENQQKEIVVKDLCIGCGKCSNVCPKDDIISYRHNERELRDLLPKCLEAGAECFELHAAVADEDVTIKEWNLLNEINNTNFNSMCLDRLNLGNLNLEKRIENAKKISKDRLIIQADGYPMSGGNDDFNTTLQAVACADVINKRFNIKANKKNKLINDLYKNNSEIYIVLSGGTNSLTKKLADSAGVKINGVAIGTFARKIVEKYVESDEIYENDDYLISAVNIARSLINVNVE
jgi:ferredoxin